MLVQVRKLRELRVGGKYRYKGKGFKVYDKDGSHVCSQNAEYDVEIIQITDNHITLRMTVDQSTLTRMCIWGPKPYNWSISIWDLEHGFENLYEEVYYD